MGAIFSTTDALCYRSSSAEMLNVRIKPSYFYLKIGILVYNMHFATLHKKIFIQSLKRVSLEVGLMLTKFLCFVFELRYVYFVIPTNHRICFLHVNSKSFRLLASLSSTELLNQLLHNPSEISTRS